MKKTLILLALVLTTPVINTYGDTQRNLILAQETKGTKFAILVQNERGLQSAIMTASEMKKESPSIQFEIVIMGPAVQQLNTSNFEATLQKANKAGIKLVVCEFALNVFGLSTKDIPDFIVGTPNAHKYMFVLQENDFNTLFI